MTPTIDPIDLQEVPDTVQLKIVDSGGSRISTLDQWRPLVRREHWRKGRSAYSLADFILNRDGAARIERVISSVLSQPVSLDQGTPEYAARFDRYGGPARLDMGITRRTGAGSSLFVGLEAKVDEPFGTETVCERFRKAAEYRKSNPRSNATARVTELLSRYFGVGGNPCESRFAGVGYQLLTGSAGTVAQHNDVPVFFIAVFRTNEFDERKGNDNRRDYENFARLAGSRVLVRDDEDCLAHELNLDGRPLVSIYRYFDLAC